VLHQVDFRKAGALVIPVGKAADRDLAFEQRAGFSAAAQPSSRAAGRPAPTIQGGGADLLQMLIAGPGDAEVTVPAERGELGIHRSS
jgi:hypothetical protein